MPPTNGNESKSSSPEKKTDKLCIEIDDTKNISMSSKSSEADNDSSKVVAGDGQGKLNKVTIEEMKRVESVSLPPEADYDSDKAVVGNTNKRIKNVKKKRTKIIILNEEEH